MAILVFILRCSGKGSIYLVSRNKWYLRILGAGFLFALVGVSILPFRVAIQNAQRSSAESTAEIAASDAWIQHRFGGEQFVVETPSNWVKTELPTLGIRGFQLTDHFNQLEIVVAATPKSDVTVKSIDVLTQMAIENIKNRGANHVVTLESAGERSGVTVNQTQVDWESEPYKLITITRQMDFPDHWVEIDLTCKPSNFLTFENRLSQIADSIRPITGMTTK